MNIAFAHANWILHASASAVKEWWTARRRARFTYGQVREHHSLLTEIEIAVSRLFVIVTATVSARPVEKSRHDVRHTSELRVRVGDTSRCPNSYFLQTPLQLCPK